MMPCICFGFRQSTGVINGARLGGTCTSGLRIHCRFCPTSNRVVAINTFCGQFGSPVRRACGRTNSNLRCACRGTGGTRAFNVRLSVGGDLSFVKLEKLDLIYGTTCVRDHIHFRRKTPRHSQPLTNRSPCLIGTNLFCRRSSGKVSTSLLCGHVKGHVRSINIPVRSRGRSVPSVCRVPHGSLSLAFSGGVNGTIRVGTKVRSVLGSGVRCGRFIGLASGGNNGHRHRRLMHDCHPKISVGINISLGFWDRLRCVSVAGGVFLL